MLSWTLAPCDSLRAETITEQDYVVEKDIVYGTGGDVKLKLDLAHPTSGDTVPSSYASFST
jgi:hypothetical protein